MIESAAHNLNDTYKQMWAIGLPQIDTWSQLLTWGQRAETTQAQLKPGKGKVAAVYDDAQANPARKAGRRDRKVKCQNCNKRGHWARQCKAFPAQEQQGKSNPEEREEVLKLLRSLSRTNLNSDL